MPSRKDDPRRTWTYEFDGAGADLQRERSKVRHPNLVESVGVDGRFRGAIRPFPGFADSTVHGVPTSGAGKTVTWTIENIKIAKYVSIQKGLSRHALRGVAMLADNNPNHNIVDDPRYTWQNSLSGVPNVYFLRFKGLGFDIGSDNSKYNPRLNEPATVTENGTPLTRNDNVATLSPGQWGWGRASQDAAGGSGFGMDWDTIYVRLSDDANPSTKATDFIQYVLSGLATYFSYYDSSDGSSDVVVLDDFAEVFPRVDNDVIDWDISSNSRYIYVVATRSDEDQKPAGLFRASWFDFPFVPWLFSEESFDSRPMGIQYGTATYDPKNDLEANSPFRFSRNPLPTGGTLRFGDFQVGVELASRKHNLRSKLGVTAKMRVGSATGDVGKATVSVLRTFQPSFEYLGTRKIDKNWWSELGESWGLHSFDTINVYRTPVDTSVVGDDLTPDVWETVSTLYLEDIVDHNNTEALVSSPQFSLSKTFYELTFGRPESTSDRGTLTDVALARNLNAYNPFLRDVGEMPPAKRIAALPEFTILGTSPFAKANAQLGWHYEGTLPEVFRFSHLALGETENFPAANVYRPSDPGETILSLEASGDYVFGVTSNNVYRFFKTGTEMSAVQVAHKIGGVSRWGQTGVGNSLYLLTRSGLREIDGNTGSVRALQDVDRLIFDEQQWGDTLESVHIEYDAFAGVLILLNTSLDEAVLLWESTGEITTLVDCPWSFLTSGPDPTTGGNRRALFVMSEGRVHCIDAKREMPKRSMFGTGELEAANGRVGGASTSSNVWIGTEEGTVPDGCVGFKLRFITGNLAGQSTTILSKNGDYEIGVALGTTPDTDSEVAIGPVVTRVTGAQLGSDRQDEDDNNSFVRKKVRTISASCSHLGGSAVIPQAGNPITARLGLGIYKRDDKKAAVLSLFDLVPDQMVSKINDGATEVYPYAECFYTNVDFQLKALLVHGTSSGQEAESRAT